MMFAAIPMFVDFLGIVCLCTKFRGTFWLLISLFLLIVAAISRDINQWCPHFPRRFADFGLLNDLVSQVTIFDSWITMFVGQIPVLRSFWWLQCLLFPFPNKKHQSFRPCFAGFASSFAAISRKANAWWQSYGEDLHHFPGEILTMKPWHSWDRG